MTTINQDDALGVGAEEYNDAQGVFSHGGRHARATAAVEPARDGGGKAKLFFIIFASVLFAAIGWVGWKVVHRGGEAVDAEALALPVADADTVPMTGAPANESPADLASAPVGPVEPGSAPPPPTTQPAAAGLQVPSADAAGDVAAAAALSASSVVDPALPAPAPNTSTGAAPASPAPAVGDDAAVLREQLRAAKARIEELEAARERSANGAARAALQPAKTRSTTPALRSRSTASVRPAATVASAEHKSTAKPLPAPAGVILKAVLEGRAWLQLGSGETVTAAPGDDVAGVGTVSVIDAERGEVRFANGAVLK